MFPEPHEAPSTLMRKSVSHPMSGASEQKTQLVLDRAGGPLLAFAPSPYFLAGFVSTLKLAVL